MTELFERLLRDDDGTQVVAYAMWVGAATAILEPYLFVAAFYRLVDLWLMLQGQLLGAL